MEEEVKKILSGLSLDVLKTIKEYPYLLDEVIYEKQTSYEKNSQVIQSVGIANLNGQNWIDDQKMGGR